MSPAGARFLSTEWLAKLSTECPPVISRTVNYTYIQIQDRRAIFTALAAFVVLEINGRAMRNVVVEKGYMIGSPGSS